MHKFTTRKEYLIISLLWLFFQTLWYFYLGVEFGLESLKYIREAQYFIEHHHFSQSRYLFYGTTIFIIAFANTLHLGLYGALLIIMAINLACYIFFFKALKGFFENNIPAFLVVVLLMSFWPYQSWSLYLFTECMFFSMVLLLFGYLLKMKGKALTSQVSLTMAFILFLLIISRPLGILFVLPTLLFLFFKLSRRQRFYFLVSGGIFLILLNFVMQVVFTTTPDWNMTRALTEDSFICDMPRADAKSQLDLTNHPNQFYQLFYYVTHNFSHFTGLAITRLKYFFLMVRDYYSTFHNLYLIVYLVLFYGSLVIGGRRIIKALPKGLNWFFASSIILFASAIALQCDDYHNRFFLTLTPFFAFTTVICWWETFKKVSFSKRHKD
ncbi:MAG: hypothetical protein EOO46_07580 [Flavobacterium sp.]|nr:MAG: hypothetical protein EOO46_07580 [Flavobacterium sp.]